MINDFYTPLLKKTNFRRFSWNGVKFELHVLDSLLFIFLKKSFLDTQVVNSSGIHQDFCKIPPLSITGHALRFDHFLKSTKIIQKKYKKVVKPLRCILIYVLVTIQNNKLGIRQIS